MLYDDNHGFPPIIYVAGPYRTPHAEQFEIFVQNARECGVGCAKKGWSPIIPHLNTQHFELMAPEMGDEHWLAATAGLLARCDAMVLLDGHEYSEGTQAEIKLARQRDIPIFQHSDQVPHVRDWFERALR